MMSLYSFLESDQPLKKDLKIVWDNYQKHEIQDNQIIKDRVRQKLKGEKNMPSTTIYISNETFDYYVRKAGGAKNASKRMSKDLQEIAKNAGKGSNDK